MNEVKNYLHVAMQCLLVVVNDIGHSVMLRTVWDDAGKAWRPGPPPLSKGTRAIRKKEDEIRESRQLIHNSFF
jgi:hypothetical protein